MPDPSVPHAFALIVLADVQTRRGHLRQASDALAAAALEIETFADAGRLPHDLAAAKRRLRAARKSHAQRTEPLSTAELAVLRLLATGLSQRQIGRAMFLSMNTIKTHTQSIYRKLGVVSRADAIARATALELIAAD
jgi:LuxR family maltose regulon positive regulatory protein